MTMLLPCSHWQLQHAGEKPGKQAAVLWPQALPILQLVIAEQGSKAAQLALTADAEAVGAAAPQAGTAAPGG